MGLQDPEDSINYTFLSVPISFFFIYKYVMTVCLGDNTKLSILSSKRKLSNK